MPNTEQNTTRKFPRVLVLSPNSFNYLSGSGVTFSHLFEGWPKDRLANLHLWNEPCDPKACTRFFLLGKAELRRFPLSPSKTATPSEGSAPAKTTGSLSWRKRLAGNSGWPESFRISPKLDEWLREFQPDIIYTILGPISVMEAVLKIQARFKAKLVVHHMDDWYKDAYTTGLFRYQRHHMLRLFHSIVDNATKRFAIGEDMALEYSQRFKNKFIPFQNTIDVRKFRKAVDSQASRGGRPSSTLLYFGSILPFAQEQSVLDVAEAILALRSSEVSSSYIFRIVAPASQLPQSLAGNPGIELVEMLNQPQQFEREIAQANALLLPANFGELAIQHLRYSMPTKLPGYLASGRPILAYAPAELAQSRYLSRQKLAELISERSATALQAGIKAVMNHSKGQALSNKAFEIALKNHDSANIRQYFQELLQEINS